LEGFKFGDNGSISKVNVLIQPTLNTDTYRLSFDAIEIVTNKKSPSRKLHIPIIITSKERFSKKEKLSIAIKCVTLSKTCGVEYEFGKIIYGSDLKTVKFKIEPFITEAKRALNELHKISKCTSQPLIFYKSHCKICEFQEACKKELIETDSLGLLHRMGEKDIKRYNNKGIFTVKQLPYTFRPRRRGKRVKTKQHLYYHSLQALAIREQKTYLYDKIDVPSAKIKVFVDMEGDSSESFIYLIGILVIENEEIEKYSLWANDFDDEKQIFGKCMQVLNRLNDAHIFYYGNYESRAFKRILKSNPTEKVKNLLMKKSTNILSVIYSNLYFPTYSNDLKEIGRFLGCTWSAPFASGIQSIVWRKKWERSKGTKLKDTLIRYNYEDCVALKTLTEFIYSAFDNKTYEKHNNKSQKVAFVEDIKDDEKPPWEDKKFVSKDIEIITKCAYFEYQRSKIFFRTNKNIRKNTQYKEKKPTLRCKANKIVTVDNYKCPNKCPACKSGNIIYDKEKFNKKVCYDLRISTYGIKKWIVIYRSPFCKCLDCNRAFRPSKIQRQKNFGHTLVSWAVHQYVVNGISLENIATSVREYFGLPLDHRTIWWFKFVAAKYYKDTYDKILKKIVNGCLIHADETGIRLQKDRGYVWVLTNMEEVFYLYRPTRESNFLHELINDFEGVLVTDFYSGYDSLRCSQQKCLVHLIRDLNNALLNNLLDDELKQLVIKFGVLVKGIIDTIDRFGLKSRYMGKHKKDVKRFYRWLLKQMFYSEFAEKFKKRMIKYEKELFLFLDHDNVPWNNNNAEHAVKHFAKYRRVVNGKISQNGLEAYLVLLSIYQTCNYKGINFLDFLLSKEKDIDKFMRKH
jgi:predicted RecB family nuclease